MDVQYTFTTFPAWVAVSIEQGCPILQGLILLLEGHCPAGLMKHK